MKTNFLNTKYRPHEPASFLRKNAIALVNLLQVLAKCQSDGNKLAHVTSFIILRSREGLTFFNLLKNNVLNLLVKNVK